MSRLTSALILLWCCLLCSHSFGKEPKSETPRKRTVLKNDLQKILRNKSLLSSNFAEGVLESTTHFGSFADAVHVDLLGRAVRLGEGVDIRVPNQDMAYAFDAIGLPSVAI